MTALQETEKLRREIEARADAYGIKGNDDAANEHAIEQFTMWLVENPKVLDAAFVLREHDHAKPHSSLFDSLLFSGKRIGDALALEIQKSGSILIALGRAMLVRESQREYMATRGHNKP